MKSSFAIALALAMAGSLGHAAAESFYTEPLLFSTAPDETKSLNMIDRFGPVGIAIELHQPAFVMKVGKLEEGSPAAATGKLKQGQIIDAINGAKLSGIDPRIQLGDIITAAEAKDGIIRLTVRDAADATPEDVIVTIPVLGSYSETWPLNCPKSDKIVRDLADHFAKPGSHKGFADFGMLFLLSTGEDKDLAVVREWVRELAKKRSSGYAWHIGYGGLAICEYYLRTGDATALPVIQQWVDAAAKGEYLDGWAGRGGVTQLGYGNGHLNAAGTGVVTFLLLAKQCGADVNESLLHRTLTHFFRYAGRGVNPYGDDRPETSFVDNGKNGKLAFAMAAAASLTPEGEKSIYARARDHMAMNSFYTTTFMLHGHTGGGIGEIWRSAAMGLLAEQRPQQYRGFMDHRRWHYELSRRFDGSFGILGGARYDNQEWGNCYPITYTIPRKTLRITGAPPSEFSKSYQLPARPWGTAADESFVSLDPIAANGGNPLDLAAETLVDDSARPLIIRLNQQNELGDDELRRYLRHPDYLIRNMVANHAGGLSIDYMFPRPGKRVRPELLLELCRHPDARARNAGFRAALRPFNPGNEWSQELFDLAIAKLQDDAESWFVKDAALSLVARGTPDMIIPQLDTILPYLEHSEQWLQNGALNALNVVITDPRCFAKVLPPVGELIRTCQRQSTTSGPLRTIREKLATASPEVRELALETIGTAYEDYAGTTVGEGGQDLNKHYHDHLEMIAGVLVGAPGGYDVLYQISTKRFPNNPLPYNQMFLNADPEKFGPELREAIKPIIRDELIYQFIGQNRRRILSDISNNPNRRSTVTNSIDELVALYQKVGIHDYDWQPFGPDLKNAKWSYYSFDPPEKQKYDISPWRYRDVTYPQGMEQWFARDFDAGRAGWAQGQPPFGQYKGEMKAAPAFAAAEPRTLWEHEVLLVRGTFDFPQLKPDHLYRLRVQTGQGVGAGDGFKVFINGKELVETKRGLDRREGNAVRGGWINSDFAGEFGNAPVSIAATSFMRYGNRAIVTMPPVPQATFGVWLEERKLPPLDEATFRKAASYVPMLSSAWQAGIDPDDNEPPSDGEKFRYDGKFAANPKAIGAWQAIDLVDSIDEFTADRKMSVGRSPIKAITLHDGGSTDSAGWIWSGDILMDLDRSQALKFISTTIAGTDYLVVEAGGFDARHPAGWESQYIIMTRPENNR